MVIPLTDERIEKMERGMSAQGESRNFIPRLLRQEEAAIMKLVREYRGGELTEGKMMAGIATVSVCRSLIGSIKSDIRTGEETITQLREQERLGHYD